MNSYTIIDVLKDLVTGKLTFTTRSVKEDRQALCTVCEVRDEARNICTACGCWLPAKVRLAKSSCPMELW